MCLVAQSCLTLCDPTDRSPSGSSVHGDSPGKNAGVGCHAVLQGIFPTQGPNPYLLHWQAGSLPLEPSGRQVSSPCLQSTRSQIKNRRRNLETHKISKNLAVITLMKHYYTGNVSVLRQKYTHISTHTN